MKSLVLAHYMPWFEADPTAKRWGWHWTMGRLNPNNRAKTRREIASKYYPLLGAYDSNDPDVLECHVLWMKFAGIDGVLIDWYGAEDFLDYGINHRNTLHLIRFLKKAGLRFAIVFEDQTVPKLIEGKRFPESDAVKYGQRVLGWMQANWFTDHAYVTIQGRPVFLTFGSGYYKEAQWREIFAPLPKLTLFYTESYRRAPADGGFSWPQPGKGTEDALKEIDGFYQAAKTWPTFLPAAFPRFDDMYEVAGVHKSWGHIDDRDGRIYRDTLERAMRSGAPMIQLVTWNDWGEGTVIEPSEQFGYRDLEVTQALRRRILEPGFSYRPEDLRLPLQLFIERKRVTGNTTAKPRLDAIADKLFAGKVSEARKLLDSSSVTRRQEGNRPV